jgi:dienelactone hydrolase
MKTTTSFEVGFLTLAMIIAINSGLCQSSALHRFSAINVQPDHTISLTVTSAVPASFLNYYDLFPIDASQNLMDWTPLATVFRTNHLAVAKTLVDLDASSMPGRFYRTPTNQLFTAIPPPDGPYRVGVVTRLFTDLSRTNRYVSTNGSFMASIWYPAQATAGIVPGLYVDPEIAALGGNYCFTAKYALMHDHALPGVPVATNETNYPLVIYSHGHQLTRTDNTRKAENLASYGFIVLAVDHINCYATVFPNGRLFYGMEAPNLGTNDPTTLFIATNRAEDVRFLLDEATNLNAQDSILQGRLNLNQIGIFGHSFGGGTSAAACAQETGIKAGLSLDGAFAYFPIPAFDQPFLILSGGDNDTFMQQYRAAYRNLYDRLAHDAYWVHLTNSAHCDFNDTAWFDSPTSNTLMRRALVQDKYITSFFRKYLRGEDNHFLDAAPSAWPEVDQFLEK